LLHLEKKKPRKTKSPKLIFKKLQAQNQRKKYRKKSAHAPAEVANFREVEEAYLERRGGLRGGARREERRKGREAENPQLPEAHFEAKDSRSRKAKKAIMGVVFLSALLCFFWCFE
jgi:hypothetical protein